jgi:NDP-hexose-3-ketoreductase
MNFNSLKFLPSLKSTNSSRPGKAGFFCCRAAATPGVDIRSGAGHFPAMADFSTQRPLSVGVHGIGDHARRTVLPAIATSPALRLAGLSTRDGGVLAEQCAAWSCPGWDSLDAMLGEGGLDAVFVATPIGLHFDDGRKVLEAGLHLWSEKAFTRNAQDAETLISLAAGRDLAVCVSLAPAHHALFTRLQGLIRAGEIGTVRAVSAHFGFSHVDASHSKYDAESGGSALLDMGYYPVLLPAVLLDAFPRVAGAATTTEPGYSVDTAGACLLEFADGVTATAQWGYGRDYINELTVIGETGALTARPAFSKPPHLPPTLTLRRQNQETPIEVAPGDQFVDMLAVFAEAVRDTEIARRMRETALAHQVLLDQITVAANG